MHEAYERILNALNLEKWMSPRQLARLLYPDLYREHPRKAYDRLIKNLQSLCQKDLLRYKDYGLGKDNLWAIKPNPLIREMGLEPPRAEIHAFKYEHEKACADVFVTLYLTGKLCGWEAHKKIVNGIIPDRTAELPRSVYLEIEMGSKRDIKEKAEKYRQFYLSKPIETREKFHVWFLVKERRQYDEGLEDLRNFPPAYSIETLDEFHKKFSDMRSDTSSD